MDIKQFPPTYFKSEGLPSKFHGSVEDMWKALFIPNVPMDSLFGSSEQDVKLGGISLLFQTAIFHIKDIFIQLRKAEDEVNKLRQKLQLSEQSCRDAQIRATVSCKNCELLQAQIARTEAVHRSIFSLMSSARSTLGSQNGKKSQAEAQVEKAYRAVHQVILETQDLLPTDEMMKDGTDFSPLATSGCPKQKRSAEVLFSPNEIPSTPDNQRSAKKQQRVRPRPTSDLLDTPPRLVIPETLENVENNGALSPVKVGGDAERTVLGYVSSNVPTTPEKGISKACDGSPILGKKSTKNGTPGRADNSCRDIFEDSPRVVQDAPDKPSPSLLKPKKVQDTKPEVKRMGSANSGGSFETPQPLQKIVKLDAVGCDVTLERRPSGGPKKMKQQKLSLKSFSRTKQDLTALKEFKGGVRAQTSDLGAEEEENRLIEMAKQASILDEEKRKKEEEEQLNQELSFAFLSQSGDDDDEVISATPQPSTAKKSGRQTSQLEKSKTETLAMTFQPVMMSTMLPTESTMATFAPNFHSTENVATFVPDFHSTEIEETFAPNYHSTERPPRNEPCTANSLLDDLVDQIGQDDTFVPRQRFLSSFDRIPEKKSDAPNFKYKGAPVRKKCDRKKLCGRDCPDCGKFLAQNQIDPNKVSRHRDVHGPISSTPRGFWNTSFPDSLREKP